MRAKVLVRVPSTYLKAHVQNPVKFRNRLQSDQSTRPSFSQALPNHHNLVNNILPGHLAHLRALTNTIPIIMANQVMVPFLVAMMLLTGVCNTLLSKYQVEYPTLYP